MNGWNLGCYAVYNSMLSSILNNYLFGWYTANNNKFRSKVTSNILFWRDTINNSLFGWYTANITMFNGTFQSGSRNNAIV